MTDIKNKERRMNIIGEFSAAETEILFRNATWAKLSDRIGKTALLACVFFSDCRSFSLFLIRF